MLDLTPIKWLVADICPQCDTDAPGALCDCAGRVSRAKAYALVTEIEHLRDLLHKAAEFLPDRRDTTCGCDDCAWPREIIAYLNNEDMPTSLAPSLSPSMQEPRKDD